MSETEEFRALSPVRSIKEGSVGRSSPIRHVEFNPGTPKSWSRQGTLDETSGKDSSSLGRSSPARHVDFNPGTPKSWSRQGTLEDNPSSERASPIRHVEFNPGTPKSCSRQGTFDEASNKDNQSQPGSPLLEKPLEPFKSFDEPIEPRQTLFKEPEKTDSGRRELAGEAEGGTGRGVCREASSPGGEGQCPRNGSTAVGEWNSLPVLVERLRAALELSLASSASNRREEETPALPEDSGVDSEEDFRVRNSTERAVLPVQEHELKNDLKFLEDLLLSDIQTALSRLRETLERIDIAALAKHGAAAADPSSKLHLLKLVSSLLSRLQVPEEPSNTLEKKASEPSVVGVPMTRKRRATRHTIGVTTEELASARKWLEEERERQNLLNSRKAEAAKVEAAAGFVEGPAMTVLTEPAARLEELHHDKCTKDAINQRQSLRDKNKETPCDERPAATTTTAATAAFRERGLVGVTAQRKPCAAELEPPGQSQSSPAPPPLVTRNQYQPKPEGCQAKANVTGDAGIAAGHENEESRVSKLAAALKERADMALSSGRFSGNNKFSAKKSRIKRANTIDIPSYLKLQAETLGQEGGTGCVSLRRPIHVGDKTGLNSVNMVPSFQPKTDNDRKFLALINKNNEAPINNQPPPFKPFGYSKPSDLSSVVNENWTSRFSNIKTTFDKASIESPDKGSLKNRIAKRFPPVYAPAQTSPGTNPPKDRPIYNSTPSMKSDSGFRHAPSSPFRKIEKAGVPLSPTKVPPVYHWAKNNSAGSPSSSLKEKAKKMFDRENVQPRGTQNIQEASGFPRPPWIENERQENKGSYSHSVTENGRLDYRSFCKQFAPFVGKGVDSKLREFEEQRERERDREQVTHRRDSASHGKVVDGRISFRMLPNNSAPVSEARRELPQFAGREKLSASGDAKPFGYSESKSGAARDTSDNEGKGKINCFGDATLRGSSSVGVQTGLEEDHLGEARSFRVAPRIIKGPASLCSNAYAQTGSDLTQPRQSEDSRSKSYERRDSTRTATQPSQVRSGQSRHFILDHNQNYRVIAQPELPNDSPTPSSQELGKPTVEHKLYSPEPIEKSPGKLPDIQKPREYPIESLDTQDNKRHEDHRELEIKAKSFAPTILSSAGIPDEHLPNMSYDRRMEWPIENPAFLDDENIQNQDISPEVGVVTRYTCAIATVESVDSPEPRSEEAGPADSRTPSSPSPSQSWSRSRPPTNGATTPEEEIRRHNLLQQSLVRRLQNERTSLNDSGATSPNYSPSRTPNYLQESYDQAAKYQPQDYYQPSNFLEPISHQSPRFLSPNTIKTQELPPRVPSPTSMGSVNRIIALREAYEQPAIPAKPVQKERSPIPNGVNPIDSSDEYLVSCATKPSRSIVLSKSESWHQLAAVNSYPRAPRINVPSGSSSSQASCQNLPKPPKPKSPSSQKLRSKQYEASSSSDSVKKMEDKIRRYFDGPTDTLEVKESRSRRSSPRNLGKGLVGLSRSRTMPGISGTRDEKVRLSIPNVQLPLLNVNTADVDKVFDDLFEEVTRTDRHHC